ncbi:unnamed protein product [Acanthosepion pharaonis]|uniref:Uncharacterized protein n=1 Tax=Acanthosepion pharaonis TaxID=158019 RepID=A0A812EQU2_ACAPH|nr:unnamed protein product [Sepia pharaonis]
MSSLSQGQYLAILCEHPPFLIRSLSTAPDRISSSVYPNFLLPFMITDISFLLIFSIYPYLTDLPLKFLVILFVVFLFSLLSRSVVYFIAVKIILLLIRPLLLSHFLFIFPPFPFLFHHTFLFFLYFYLFLSILYLMENLLSFPFYVTFLR